MKSIKKYEFISIDAGGFKQVSSVNKMSQPLFCDSLISKFLSRATKLLTKKSSSVTSVSDTIYVSFCKNVRPLV